MAPFGLKLCQNAFQTIPDISFFDAEDIEIFAILREISNGRLPLEDGSDWPETWAKRVSDDPRHFIFRRREAAITVKI